MKKEFKDLSKQDIEDMIRKSLSTEEKPIGEIVFDGKGGARAFVLQKNEIPSWEHEQLLKTKLSAYNFGQHDERIQNKMKDLVISTVGELIQWSAKDLLKQRYVGKQIVADVEKLLATLGLALRPS
jgi:DNA-directed RNA polymerase alpha subunit